MPILSISQSVCVHVFSSPSLSLSLLLACFLSHKESLLVPINLLAFPYSLVLSCLRAHSSASQLLTSLIVCPSVCPSLRAPYIMAPVWAYNTN